MIHNRLVVTVFVAGASLAALAQVPGGRPVRNVEGIAAVRAAREVPPMVVPAEKIAESTFSEPEMATMGAVPGKSCSARPRTIMLGKADDFGPSPEPIFVSPTAKAVLGKTLVGFDASYPDRNFVVSANLGQCKLCGVRDVMTVELKVKRLPGISGNDKVYLYFSDGSSSSTGLTLAVPVKFIWQGDAPTLTTKVITLQVPLTAVNNYIFAHNVAFLDVVVQDDTAIDYVKITW